MFIEKLPYYRFLQMTKQLLTTLILLLVTGVSSANASETIDSLSYVLGHQYTLATMAGKNEMMQCESDFFDYIRGIEENYRSVTQINDSSYMVSYILGAIEAIFITDGVHGKKKEDLPPFSCIISGLRKVENGEISLPADTVAAKAVLNRYCGEGMNPENLDADICCKFFEAYGTLKAYQPGLQEYIDDLNPGTSCVADRKAYAAGMADVLEVYSKAPHTAYDMGRFVAFSVNLNAMENDSPDMFSFVAGAKAALGLGEQFIPRDEVEELLNQRYVKEFGVAAPLDDTENFETVMEYYDKIDVEFDTQYSVNWTVTAGTVADVETDAYRSFLDVTSVLDIENDCIQGILMSQSRDKSRLLYDTALCEIEKFPLPEGYKWFCGRNIDGQTTIGVMRTNPQFKATVNKASVNFDPVSGMINVEWKFDTAGALKWAEFTAANVGKHIAMEINGEFMFAPKVNQQISGGACSINSLSPEEINSLFKDSNKVVNQTPIDTIEVIEIE